jgi:antitoxin FitA
MPKTIQLRNVPDALHRHLRAHAAMAGMSLSDYLLAELKEIGERRTLAELRECLHRRKPVLARFDSALPGATRARGTVIFLEPPAIP